MADYKLRFRLFADDAASKVFHSVGRAMDDARDSASKMGSVLNEAFGFDIGAADIVRTAFDIGTELNAIGAQANVVESNFSELADELGGAAHVMDTMRTATGGVINDMQLMTSANSLMLTGIAQSADDLGAMTSGAIKLGAAMGQDAASSIENFNSAMLNMSYERLDTLGVSASNVRERVKELKEAGIETGDAFQQAVLEQMEVSLGRLGDAATSSETALNRVTTRFKNLQTEVGQFVARGVESGAMLIEIGVVLVEREADRRQTERETMMVAETLGDSYARRFTEAFETSLNREDISAIMAETLADETSSLQDVVLATGNMRLQDRFMAGDTQTMDEIAHAMQYALTLERERLAVVTDINARNEQYAASIDRQADSYLDQLSAQRASGEMMSETNRITERSVTAWGDILNLSRGAMREFNGVSIATEQAATEAERLAFETEQAYIQAERLGLEGDALQSFKDAKDEARGIADEFARASDNLRTMDLETALGGGRNASANMLRDVMAAAGVDTRTSGLMTGDMSITQINFEDEVAPLLQTITDQLGDEAGAMASKRFTDSYMAALEAGMGEAQALERAKQAIGYELGEGAGGAAGASFTVAYGDTVSGLAAEHGLSQEQVMALLGISDPSQLVAGMVSEMQAELVRLSTVPDSETGRGGFVEDAGMMGDRMIEQADPLEERRLIIEGVRDTLYEMSEVTPPDLSSASMGLDSSVEQAGTLASSLDTLASTTYRVRVVYDVQINGSVPAGAGSPTTVVSSGEM